jgi:hypothetical protein
MSTDRPPISPTADLGAGSRPGLRVLGTRIVLPRGLIEVLWLFITLRVSLSLFALLLWSGNNLPGPCHFELARDNWLTFPPLDDQSPAFQLIGVWQRWDACWYTKIATHGYALGDNSVNFWPLFPALTSVVGRLLGGDMALGGLVVNAFAYIIAMVGLLRLVGLDFGRRIASRTVLFLSVFPTAFFLFAPFTEAVFLAAAVWAIYASRQRKWLLAAGAGFLAALTRIQGVFLVFPIGWEALMAVWIASGAVLSDADTVTVGRRLSRRLWALLSVWQDHAVAGVAVLAPAIGFVGFLSFASAVSGQTPLDTQEAWGGKNFYAPWDVIAASWNWAMNQHDVIQLVNLGALILFGGATIAGLTRMPLAYSLYAAPQVLLLATRIQPTPLTSTARYLLVVFPVFVLLALAGRNRRFERAWLLFSVLVMAYLLGRFLQGDYVA